MWDSCPNHYPHHCPLCILVAVCMLPCTCHIMHQCAHMARHAQHALTSRYKLPHMFASSKALFACSNFPSATSSDLTVLVQDLCYSDPLSSVLTIYDPTKGRDDLSPHCSICELVHVSTCLDEFLAAVRQIGLTMHRSRLANAQSV